MSRSFTSSDPVEVAKFCAKPAGDKLTDDAIEAAVTRMRDRTDPLGWSTHSFTADEMAAMRASLEMAQGALDDMRTELAVARAWGERGWARVKLLESKIDAVREVIR